MNWEYAGMGFAFGVMFYGILWLTVTSKNETIPNWKTYLMTGLAGAMLALIMGYFL